MSKTQTIHDDDEDDDEDDDDDDDDHKPVWPTWDIGVLSSSV
jgi:hypothetical protein